MKPIVFLLLIFCQQLHLKAQTPEFGKIDLADLQMKDCALEPGAGAMILLD